MTKIERKIAEYHRINEDDLYEDFHVICPRCKAHHILTGMKLLYPKGDVFQCEVCGLDGWIKRTGERRCTIDPKEQPPFLMGRMESIYPGR